MHGALHGRLIGADLTGQHQHQIHQEGVPRGGSALLGVLTDLTPRHGGVPEDGPQGGQVVPRQIPARLVPVDEHRPGGGQEDVREQGVAVTELPLHVREPAQQLLEIAEVPVGQQPQFVEAGDALAVVQRHLEQADRGPPLVDPVHGAERGPDVRARRRLDRMPLRGCDPPRHPLDDQRAVVRVGRDEPGHAHRRPVPHERAICGYFVPEPLGPAGRMVQ